MDNKTVLHDLKRIANTMRLMAMEAKKEHANISRIRSELAILAQHIDKLYNDIEIKFKNMNKII